MQFQDWMFDKRVLRRNIRKDVISREDYKAYLESLPDVSENIADEEEEEEAEADAEATAEAEETEPEGEEESHD